MKQNILLSIVLIAFSAFVSAQTEYDAARLSQTDLTGTARYVSLGGAMGALGADASAIKDNPAGLGVYRSSELTATMNLSLASTQPVEWHHNKTYQDSYSKLSFNNAAYVIAIPKDNNGLVSSNFSFAYQKLNDFNKSFRLNGGKSSSSFTDYLAIYSSPNPPIVGDVGYDNDDMPWLTTLGFDGYLINIDGQYFNSLLLEGELVTPSYIFNQAGSLDEFSFGWGGNFNNNLFLGTSLNIRSLDYSLKTTLTEDFENGGGFDLVNSLVQSGIGVNAKLGVIYLPTNALRFGLSFHTPSITYFSEESYADLHSSEIPSNENNPAETPVNSQAFNLWSPLQVQASAACLLGKMGLISAEYNFINYPGSRFEPNFNSTQAFGEINEAMKDVLNNVHVVKAGAEARLTPNFSLRAGYAWVSPTVRSDYKNGKLLTRNSVNTNTEYFDQKYNTSHITFGFGYRKPGWFIDFAYAIKQQKEDFFPYQDRALAPAVLNGTTTNAMVTLGLRM